MFTLSVACSREVYDAINTRQDVGSVEEAVEAYRAIRNEHGDGVRGANVMSNGDTVRHAVIGADGTLYDSNMNPLNI